MNERFPQVNEQDERLDATEAQEEANMMRVKLNLSPETGTKLEDGFGKKPTKKDYERAFQAVEEMKRLVEEEPATEIILNKVLRIAENARINAEALLYLIATRGTAHSNEERHDRIMAGLEDEASRLKKLQEEAEKFEK